jgi:hypothetical protein
MTTEANNNDVLVSYYGPFSMRVISNIGKYLLESENAIELAKMRLYRVLIELSQNVALYSYNRLQIPNQSTLGVGSVKITSNNDHYKCQTLNKILPEHKDILIKNCAEINNSNEFELKKKKMILRNESSLRDNSAHIGLITMSLYSGNPLEFNVLNDNESQSHYFSINVTINKK